MPAVCHWIAWGRDLREIKCPVAVGIFDAGRKTHAVQKVQERFGWQVFDIGHLFNIPFASCDQHGGRNRRHTSGIGNALTADFVIGILVIRNVIDQNLGFLAVLGALDQITDAGFAGVIRCQRAWVGQAGLYDLKRYDFKSPRPGGRVFQKEGQCCLEPGTH